MGISDDLAFEAEGDDPLGGIEETRGSLTGKGAPPENDEDPPSFFGPGPHAEARFASVAGKFSRRCAPLFAR
jgi:hypothetical protein